MSGPARKKCCDKCSLTDACCIFVDMVNAEDTLCLALETLKGALDFYAEGDGDPPPPWVGQAKELLSKSQ